VALFALADQGQGRFLNPATLFSVLQQFATIGPIALGLGLTMIAREYDLSVGGVMSLAGCIAVMTGDANPLLGVAAALAAGCLYGAAQGAIMTRLNIGSVGVTLGGLLAATGLTYVLTGNATIGYARSDIAALVNAPFLAVLSIRNVAALAAFAIAGFSFRATRLGRDLTASGSDRRAARTAGVNTSLFLIGVFALSGMLASLSGSLLSYSLAAASPAALADALIPATASAIIGGVSLGGGKGTPFGIAAGVLVLCVLRSGMTAIGLAPYATDLVTGSVLLIVALLDSQALAQRLYEWRPRPRS
jgi:ribose/xylose/arabinose/galactoside ABC-type transport system permease subunit